ncbi:MAG: TlpA family protein disulfide reductase [Proteobacteria bacterium]|nr:TlpA family protein disulfide reductase [Pseudomonadota bacterium]MBU1585472.1 TlpA family protein disulfide reductase [Pseudomonadota bacterium]MBU2454800.1 TlpA family protein disulfide reductase [Pseudomonadota bacterium]
MGELSTGHKAWVLFFLFGIGIGILFFLIGNNLDFTFKTLPNVAAGSPAPDFSLPDLDGNAVRLSDYKGKLVLLNIWATWCRPCVDEMPSIEKLYNTFKNNDFQVLAASVDTRGKKAVGPFMTFHNLSFKALLDTEGTLKKAYRTTGIPESFIIDKNGVIIEKIIGSIDWSSPGMIQYFKEQLEKPNIPKG